MSETGRYYVKKDGRTFVVEPIDNSEGKSRKKWGDVDPASGEIQGTYGNKYSGAIKEEDSIITPENNFKNIVDLPVGVSPDSYIEDLIARKQSKYFI